jgi:putative ABC transport system permease protein
MVFAITIFFIFTSIQYNEQVIEFANSKQGIYYTFLSSSVVIAIFSAIFIWYSNSFFTRKRKKEVALYSLLGVKKRQIGRMLFYENLIIGIIAMGVAVLIGSILSKLFIMALMKLMGLEMLIDFVISIKAIQVTIATFTIIFIIASLHGYSLIYRFKLIELFKADNVREKEPKASIIFSILAILLIGAGYYSYLKYTTILETLITVIIGTYFFFASFTVFVVKLSKKNIKKYYKGVNMIATSQLAHRIKANARTLATIAVLSATTLTAMEVVASMYYDFSTNLNIHNPFTYAYVSPDKAFDKQIEDLISKYPNNKILKAADVEFTKVMGKFPNTVKDLKKYGDMNSKDRNIYLMSESSFNETAQLTGMKDRINLKSEKETVLYDEYFNEVLENSYVGETVTLNNDGSLSDFKVTELNTNSPVNHMMTIPVMIVKDVVYNKFYNPSSLYRIRGYITDNPKHSEALNNDMYNMLRPLLEGQKITRSIYSSYYSDYKEGIVQNGLALFVGTFLGLVFLICTGSIIFFRQLSEATYDAASYKVLKNIGVSKKEIKASISSQILFIFSLPLVVGIVHSLVANTLMKKVFHTDFTLPVIITISAYTFIYMLYYLITVSSYNKIVNAD